VRLDHACREYSSPARGPKLALAGVDVNQMLTKERDMAKKSGGRKYGKGASKKVERAMHEKKAGTLKSGRSGRKVTSRKQAIAIGLSEAREAGAKVPAKKRASKKTTRKK
jgi:hypothetical protein